LTNFTQKLIPLVVGIWGSFTKERKRILKNFFSQNECDSWGMKVFWGSLETKNAVQVTMSCIANTNIPPTHNCHAPPLTESRKFYAFNLSILPTFRSGLMKQKQDKTLEKSEYKPP